MKTEKRRAFIIHFAYFSILFLMAFVVLKYGLSMLSPFVAAFLIAWVLNGPIGFVSKRLRLSWKAAAILVVLLFLQHHRVFDFPAGCQGVFRGKGTHWQPAGYLRVLCGAGFNQFFRQF